MALQLHILFWLNKAKKDKQGKSPLLIRITHNKQRKQLTTSYRLLEWEWEIVESDKKKIQPDLQAVRDFIKTFHTKIHTLTNKLELENRFSLDELLELYSGKDKIEKGLLQLIEEHNQKLKERVGLDRTKSTLEKYQFMKDKVKRFIQTELGKRELPLIRLQISFIKDFVHFLITKEGNQHNTIAKYVKNLKHVIMYGIEHGYLNSHPFEKFKMGYKDIKRTYLTAAELDILANYSFANKKFELVRDLFIFQCYTGLAYIDMANLTTQSIIQGIDKKPWIITHRQKTKSQSLIPLLKPALDIISRYKNHPWLKEGDLLPTYSIQKFNTYLKEISDICGIDKQLSSHAGRRTFATTVALGNGVSLESIAKVLGHSNTKMTSIYAVVTDMKLSEEMEKLANKL